ncbi:gamma subclass chorismate mutase AroQ [Pseudomonas farsensis]|uniref:chorismate mutase n=1 Tax=Pseudomonas farsensis TaxID=2745492 RepID=A0ABU8QV42_9PSED
MRLTHALPPFALTLALAGCTAASPTANQFAPLLDAIEQRLDLARSVAQHKWRNDLPVEAPERERQVLAKVRLEAADYGLSPARATAFFTDQMEANKLIQYALLDRWATLDPNALAAPRDLASELRPRLDKLQASLLFELAELDRKPMPDCTRNLADALAGRTDNELRHLALVRATGQLCLKQ